MTPNRTTLERPLTTTEIRNMAQMCNIDQGILAFVTLALFEAGFKISFDSKMPDNVVNLQQPEPTVTISED